MRVRRTHRPGVPADLPGEPIQSSNDTTGPTASKVPTVRRQRRTTSQPARSRTSITWVGWSGAFGHQHRPVLIAGRAGHPVTGPIGVVARTADQSGPGHQQPVPDALGGASSQATFASPYSSRPTRRARSAAAACGAISSVARWCRRGRHTR